MLNLIATRQYVAVRIARMQCVLTCRVHVFARVHLED